MHIISFINMKGGVAKTTLAVNVAEALAGRFDKKVLLIDLDPQFNATQCLIAPETYVKKLNDGDHTVLQIFDDSPQNIVSMTSGVSEQTAISFDDIEPWAIFGDGSFDLLPGNLELYRLDMGAGQGREHRLKRYLEVVKKNKDYDFVLIDTPPTPSAWMNSALIASDYYLVPVKPEPLSVTGIDLLRGVVSRCSENYGEKIDCIGVVLTIADERTKVFGSTVEFLDQSPVWKGKRFKTSLPKRTKIAGDQGDQVTILDSETSETKTALVNITNELLERINDDE